MSDFLYVALSVGFFAACGLYAIACAKLKGATSDLPEAGPSRHG